MATDIMEFLNGLLPDAQASPKVLESKYGPLRLPDLVADGTEFTTSVQERSASWSGIQIWGPLVQPNTRFRYNPKIFKKRNGVNTANGVAPLST